MKLSQLKNRVAHTEIRVGEGDEDLVRVSYMPGKIDYGMAEEMQRLAQGANPDESVVVTLLSDLVESWDLQDDDGNDLPVSEEVVKQLPLDFVGSILIVIQGEMTSGPLSSGTLPDGSQPEGGSVTPLHTTRSSERQGSLV